MPNPKGLERSRCKSMSILQEYTWIRGMLRPGEFDAMNAYLALRVELSLGDLYYNEVEYNKFAAWWETQKAEAKA